MTRIETIDKTYLVRENFDEIMNSATRDGFYKVSEYGTKYLHNIQLYVPDHEEIETIYINGDHIISIKEK